MLLCSRHSADLLPADQLYFHVLSPTLQSRQPFCGRQSRHVRFAVFLPPGVLQVALLSLCSSSSVDRSSAGIALPWHLLCRSLPTGRAFFSMRVKTFSGERSSDKGGKSKPCVSRRACSFQFSFRVDLSDIAPLVLLGASAELVSSSEPNM